MFFNGIYLLQVIFKYKKEYEEEEADYTCYDGNGTVSSEESSSATTN